MNVKDMKAEIASTSYPGRGILLGRSEDGKKAVIAYFIMGRSANSRNRVFEAMGDDLRTRAFDESKMEDPSLVIYNAVRVLGETTIGDSGRAGHQDRHQHPLRQPAGAGSRSNLQRRSGAEGIRRAVYLH